MFLIDLKLSFIWVFKHKHLLLETLTWASDVDQSTAQNSPA